MATMIPMVNVSSSPPSGGTRTHHGTPSTIPTIMSPEAGSDGYDSGSSIPKFELANSSSNLATRRNLSVAPVAIPTRLSPTAEDFTPKDTATFAPDVLVGLRSQGQATSPVSDLFLDSSPDTSPYSSPGGAVLTDTPQKHVGVIGSGPTRRSGTAQRSPIYQYGFFTTDDKQPTRAFVVTGVCGNSVPSLYEYIAISYKNFSSIVNINAQDLSKGIFSVEFNDYEEAKQALFLTVDFIFYNQSVQCYRLFPKDLVRMSGRPTGQVTNFLAQYIVSIVDVGTRVSRITAEDVFQACNACGKVKAFHAIRSLHNAVMSFRVEWSNARTNVTQLSMALLAGFRITIVPHTPDVVQGPPPNGIGLPSPFFDSDQHTRDVMAFLQPETPNRASVSATHNVVDIMKIMLGQDVRTTIMLRNIPNRVNQANLKKLLDETSQGQYDFMYLRIDFANNCNVGYAFINFVDPMAIVPFAKARAGQKWNLFSSDKVAEISYATIQGRDCLIQKFRNSSVMLEREEFRPKLFRTGKGPDAGEPEIFPKADNQAKLKRSCDNAEHVGLYLPETPTTPGTRIPTQGPVTLPPPRNQKAGGTYTRPAHTRNAIAFNKAVALLEENVHLEDMFYPPSSSEPSPTSEPTHSMRPDFETRGTFANSMTPGLYAPREGQAYRERQRRQFSQFDRGTPGAESELATAPDRLGCVVNRSTSDPFNDSPVGGSRRPMNFAALRTGYAGGTPYAGRPVQPPLASMPSSYPSHLISTFQGLAV